MYRQWVGYPACFTFLCAIEGVERAVFSVFCQWYFRLSFFALYFRVWLMNLFRMGYVTSKFGSGGAIEVV